MKIKTLPDYPKARNSIIFRLTFFFLLSGILNMTIAQNPFCDFDGNMEQMMEEYPDRVELNLKDYKAGVYFIRITENGALVKVEKLVVLQ